MPSSPGYKREYHGCTGTPEYVCWLDMRKRCTRKTFKQFKDYGGRGITVCDRWARFTNFLADMGPRPVGATLERQRNNEGYEPGNCVWAPRRDQARNRRSNRMIEIDGETKCIIDWCRHYQISWSTVQQRVQRKGVSVLDALTAPLDGRGRRNFIHA